MNNYGITKLEAPVHSLTLPSSGEQIKFRPFLMKEQKLLMLSQEGENKSELFDTLSTVIDECTFKKLNVKNKTHI